MSDYHRRGPEFGVEFHVLKVLPYEMGPVIWQGPFSVFVRFSYLATRSFRPLAAEKWAYFLAGIVIVAPVAGLRP